MKQKLRWSLAVVLLLVGVFLSYAWYESLGLRNREVWVSRQIRRYRGVKPTPAELAKSRYFFQDGRQFQCWAIPYHGFVRVGDGSWLRVVNHCSHQDESWKMRFPRFLRGTFLTRGSVGDVILAFDSADNAYIYDKDIHCCGACTFLSDNPVMTTADFLENSYVIQEKGYPGRRWRKFP